MEIFDSQSIKRAIKAFRYLPLNTKFYEKVQTQGLNAEQVFLKKEHYQLHTTQWFKSTGEVENAFRWLITIGVLRREVDGQGLTSKIRLTPLGRQILEKTPEIQLHPKEFGLREKLNRFFYRNWPFR